MNASKLLIVSALSAVISAVSAGTLVANVNNTAILALHNQYRSQVSPTAANMLALQWSNTLATVAANYGLKCIWAHNANRTQDANGTFSYVGENIYISASSSALASFGPAAVTSWNSENQSYTYQASCGSNAVCGNCTSGQQCGHYTQNVWANSGYVGCAVVNCPTMANNYPFNCTQYGTCTFVVCDYGVGGNYLGQAPYVSGTKCSKCPATASKCNSTVGLCYNSTAPVIKDVLPGAATSTTNDSVTPSDSNNAAVIGGVAGVVALAAVVAGVVIYRRKRATQNVDGYVAQ
eukprot:TRINITY_DN711_c0_g1_i1.p1 TRINITY_DN711_c0_g1~~TRINITY_DN711_c0_g1_i1.p1  ORF type:complete len:292 (-),score=64.91 TRINITY_DN711_c0_g1_i1:48-923(-)